jgi:hypothetical protein
MTKLILPTMKKFTNIGSFAWIAFLFAFSLALTTTACNGGEKKAEEGTEQTDGTNSYENGDHPEGEHPHDSMHADSAKHEHPGGEHPKGDEHPNN